MKPIILITASRTDGDVRLKKRFSLPANYSRSIIQAGAIPVIACEGEASDYADIADAILFSGGVDVDPQRYGEEKINDTLTTDESRDIEELKLFNAFYNAGKPIFGICRGIQLINVALGGTLWQDIPYQLTNAIQHADNAAHRIEISKDSQLNGLFGEIAYVNSYHHQSVKKLGKGLKITAQSDDNVIEAIEAAERKIFAMQWHPERMDLNEECGTCMDVLFKMMITMCKS